MFKVWSEAENDCIEGGMIHRVCTISRRIRVLMWTALMFIMNAEQTLQWKFPVQNRRQRQCRRTMRNKSNRIRQTQMSMKCSVTNRYWELAMTRGCLQRICLYSNWFSFRLCLSSYTNNIFLVNGDIVLQRVRCYRSSRSYYFITAVVVCSAKNQKHNDECKINKHELLSVRFLTLAALKYYSQYQWLTS